MSLFGAMLNPTITKKVNGKSDLSAILGEGLVHLQSSMQRSESQPPEDLMDVIASLRKKQKPPKKLPSPVTSDIVKVTTPVKSSRYFMLKKLTMTREMEFRITDKITSKVSFTFEGPEKQTGAWNDFKKKIPTSSAVVRISNIVLNIENGKIEAKGLTGAAQNLLDTRANRDDKVDKEKVLGLIDELVETDVLTIYSTDVFHYAQVFPLEYKLSQFKRGTSTVHKVEFSGYIFPEFVRFLSDCYPGSEVCSTLRLL